MEEHRVCKQCGIEKSINEFHLSKVNRGGHKLICAKCYNWNHRPQKFKEFVIEKQKLAEKGLKRCPRCKEIKEIIEYAFSKQKKDGLRSYCKSCEQQINLEKSRTPKFIIKQHEYMATPQYLQRLKDRYHKKMDTNENFKTGLYLRNELNVALKNQGVIKNTQFNIQIGCTIDELNRYLETQFIGGMTWENHNRHGWHIDHIIPVNAFNFKDPVQQRACFYFKNLRPMWGRLNIQKGDKYKIEDFSNYMDWFIKNVVSLHPNK
jgi:hypothetical protein